MLIQKLKIILMFVAQPYGNPLTPIRFALRTLCTPL